MNSCDDDNVIFVGSGSTGAAHKLIGIMDIKEPPVCIHKMLFFFVLIFI